MSSEPKRPREARSVDVDGAVRDGCIHPGLCLKTFETLSFDVAEPTAPTRTSTRTFDIIEDWNGQGRRLDLGTPTQLAVFNR